MEDELKECEITSVLQLEMQPRSPPWQRLMNLLCNDQTVLAGFECDCDKTVLHDTLGIECIDQHEQHHYLTQSQGEHRLFRQFQLVDFQVLAPSHLPAVAGYDSKDPDPMNLPINMELDVCAKIGLMGAVMLWCCAAILQDAVYKYNHVGNTEPKLLQYHDEAANLTVFIYAPPDANERGAAME